MASDPRAVFVSGVEFGAGRFVAIAGPCAVESEQQILAVATRVAAAGATVLRGGAYKPRTSPYSFQGLGEEGLKLLAKARRETGLRIVTEAMSPSHIGLVAEYADIVQIGSRSMENAPLLAAAARCGRPVLLKRGMSATVEEMAEAARYLMDSGSPGVVLCERGVRTFGAATRNTCDIVAVPVLQRMTGLPVILDPSHATGVRDLVMPLARAGVAIGADGLIVEVHTDPDRAWSDPAQTLSCDQFDEMMRDLQPLLKDWSQWREKHCGVAVGA